MSKSSVGIAALKANLSACLRRVRRGETMTVFDRETAIAKIVPVNAGSESVLRIRRARGSLSSLQSPKPLRTRTDILALLAAERGDR